EDEKLNIAKQHLVSKQIQRNGLKESEITIEDSALVGVIRYYTREAGVRSLEREISKICRKAVKRILLDKSIKHVRSIRPTSRSSSGCSVSTTARRPTRTRWGRCVVWRGPKWGAICSPSRPPTCRARASSPTQAPLVT